MKNKRQKSITATLNLFLKKQGDYIVAMCPALDLSSYGRDNEDAKKAFAEAFEIFIEETMEKGTLEKELLRLGWQLQLKPVAKYKPPVSHDFPKSKQVREKVQIPIA